MTQLAESIGVDKTALLVISLVVAFGILYTVLKQKYEDKDN